MLFTCVSAVVGSFPVESAATGAGCVGTGSAAPLSSAGLLPFTAGSSDTVIAASKRSTSVAFKPVLSSPLDCNSSLKSCPRQRNQYVRITVSPSLEETRQARAVSLRACATQTCTFIFLTSSSVTIPAYSTFRKQLLQLEFNINESTEPRAHVAVAKETLHQRSKLKVLEAVSKKARKIAPVPAWHRYRYACRLNHYRAVRHEPNPGRQQS